ncbi:MAG: hypothetical protein KA477_00035 [Candidatus Levybacteria bacterium]|jgi:hypothetical protein|nr:hypothetical protein [Candidatus Levybacteria bacterium]
MKLNELENIELPITNTALPITVDASIDRSVTLCGEIVGDMFMEFNGRKDDESSLKRVSFIVKAPIYFQTDRGAFKREVFHAVEVTGPLCFKFLDREKFQQGETVWLKGTHIFEDLVFPDLDESYTYSNLVLENQDDSVYFPEELMETSH